MPWVKGVAEVGDHFGAALAIADHDGDGFNDLSIGVPDESLNGRKKAGGVIVLYGRVGGVSAAGSDFWKAGYDDLAGASEDYDHFGTTLRGVDFDGDSFADLAVGVPGEDLTVRQCWRRSRHLRDGSRSQRRPQRDLASGQVRRCGRSRSR